MWQNTYQSHCGSGREFSQAWVCLAFERWPST